MNFKQCKQISVNAILFNDEIYRIHKIDDDHQNGPTFEYQEESAN